MCSHIQFLAFLLVLCASLRSGESATCFQCSSPVGGDCDHPLNVSKVKTQKCTGAENYCLLLNVTSTDRSEIRRGCAHAEFCSQNSSEIRNKRQVTTFSRSCNTCSWSYCNSAQNVAPTLALGIAGLALIRHYLQKCC